MSVAKIWNPSTLQWEAVIVGKQGPVGPSAQREARSDWVSPNSYIGIAELGSLETDTAWRVTRITVTGSTVTTAVASPIRWVDRLTAVYI